MITLLEEVLERSDGAYISAQDLQTLDRAIASWQLRRETYDLIQSQEDAILDRVATYLDRNVPNMEGRYAETGTDKCRQDMSMVLRYCATAMLLQDEQLLKERLLYWLQNIMRALRKQKVNDRAYRFLQQVAQELLPPQNANLLMPYLVITHEWLSQ
jgi:hypothetical protein